MRVGIIDYGVGNLGSMARALEELNVDSTLIQTVEEIDGVDRLILPGVGNFTECMQRLAAGNWVDAIRKAVTNQSKGLLGVCVGMQLLADYGSEGAEGTQGTPGLGLIAGRVEHLRNVGCGLRVPHVGWNSIKVQANDSTLFRGIPDGTDFYFVHSYAFRPAEAANILATANYDVDFAVAVGSGRVLGTQFHPEKSSKAGFRILKNFAESPLC